MNYLLVLLLVVRGFDRSVTKAAQAPDGAESFGVGVWKIVEMGHKSSILGDFLDTFKQLSIFSRDNEI